MNFITSIETCLVTDGINPNCSYVDMHSHKPLISWHIWSYEASEL